MRSVIFNIYFLLLNLLLYVVCIPLLFMPHKYVMKGCQFWSYLVIHGARKIIGIEFQIKGRIPRKPCVIASKHQSAWETAFFWLIIKQPCFVLKKELMYIPFFGLYLYRAHQIWINRAKGTSAIKKLLVQTRARLKEGHSVIIFPEGTRTLPGAKPHYKSGIATIYANTDKPVVPVRLNSGNCWPRNSFFKKPGKITVEFLETMPIGLTKQGFMHELQKRIEEKG